MPIELYEFGHIQVNGKSYSADVIVYPDKVDSPWWRRQGHYLEMKDLAQALDSKPHKIIIGTGYYGKMEVPPETLDALKTQGIATFVGSTAEAVSEFNRQPEGPVCLAALHLTC